MQFHQALVSSSFGDALTNSAFELRDILRLAGPSEIYARFRDDRLGDEVLPLDRFASRRTPDPSGDVLIFHSSIGEPEVTNLVANRPERLVVVYHNVSPWQPMLPFDPRFAGLLASGRRELATLADKAIAAITVSHYNAAELRELGFANVVVAPLPVDVERLREVEPHGPTTNHYEQAMDGPVILYVGQVRPHKRVDLLIEAYHVLTTYLVPEARLAIVGSLTLPAYAAHIRHQIDELNLTGAWMTGSVPLDQLVAHYRGASAFVTMSEHEGFCVPLLEAMGFDVPVIARDLAAIPETMGDAGVLLPGDDDPVLAAEAMAEVIESAPLRSQLVDAGRRRVAACDPDVARAQLVDAVFAAALGEGQPAGALARRKALSGSIGSDLGDLA